MEQKVRRTRGPVPGKRKKITTRINGHGFRTIPEAVNKWPEVLERCAGSDDTGGTTVANAATSPAAGTGHYACADLGSEEKRKGAMPRVLSEKRVPLPCGREPLPADRNAFVEAVHARVDLVEAWEQQVRSEDEKIAQRALERLDEMRYEHETAGAEELREFDTGVTPARRSNQELN